MKAYVVAIFISLAIGSAPNSLTAAGVGCLAGVVVGGGK